MNPSGGLHRYILTKENNNANTRTHAQTAQADRQETRNDTETTRCEEGSGQAHEEVITVEYYIVPFVQLDRIVGYELIDVGSSPTGNTI